FFSSRRRHTRFSRDWSSDVCSSDLFLVEPHARQNGCPSDAVQLALVYLAGEPFFGFIISHSFSDSILPRAVNSPAPWSHSPPSRSEERRVGKECRARWSRGESLENR